MKKLKTLKAVYSYMFPEVKKAIFETIHPKLVDKTNTGIQTNYSWNGFEGFLSNFLKSPEEMDSMHLPILTKWAVKHTNTLKGIIDITNEGNFYPTAGSEEGIREYMTFLMGQGVHEIYVLKGEYEGYRFVGETREFKLDIPKHGIYSYGTIKTKIHTIEVSMEEALNIKDKWFFISNPSARDGNIIENDFIEKLSSNGNKIFYDLAYLDSTDFHKFDLSFPGIQAVVMSFSKPYGLFYFRFGGLFSRCSIPGLVGNKWFKVVPSILIADRILDTIDPIKLVGKYRPVQQKIVQSLQEQFDLPFQCSDALLIANIKNSDLNGIPKNKLELIEDFKRGDGYRFCLKPYYEDAENENT